MKILLLLPLLLGFSVPAIAHNEANGGDARHINKWGGEVEEGDISTEFENNRDIKNSPGDRSVEEADFSDGFKNK